MKKKASPINHVTNTPPFAIAWGAEATPSSEPERDENVPEEKGGGEEVDIRRSREVRVSQCTGKS